jgi:hypothetical protein
VDNILNVRYRFVDGVDWDRLLDRFAVLKRRAAIVGPRGSGKTTLQEDLAARLEEQGETIRWLRFNRENRRQVQGRIDSVLAAAGPEELLFVDGAEQLGPISWRRFLGRAASFAGLVITLHTPGRQPTLIDCRTTPELLYEIVETITPPDETPSRRQLDDLFLQHQGNLRLCLRELYDLWATKIVATNVLPADSAAPRRHFSTS